MASNDVPGIYLTEIAEHALAEFAFGYQREAWIRLFGILSNPQPDGARKRELPFPWVAVVYRDAEFEIWYRLRPDGGVNVLDVQRRGVR